MWPAFDVGKALHKGPDKPLKTDPSLASGETGDRESLFYKGSTAVTRPCA